MGDRETQRQLRRQLGYADSEVDQQFAREDAELAERAMKQTMRGIARHEAWRAVLLAGAVLVVLWWIVGAIRG